MWRIFGVVLLMTVQSCGTFTSPAKHPVPPAIERVNLDRCWIDAAGNCTPQPSPEKELRFSLRSEPIVSTDVGYTFAAWMQEREWLANLVRAYCEAREVLIIANGETAKPEGVCKP